LIDLTLFGPPGPRDVLMSSDGPKHWVVGRGWVLLSRLEAEQAARDAQDIRLDAKPAAPLTTLELP
jgi:hypothetical protein